MPLIHAAIVAAQNRTLISFRLGQLDRLLLTKAHQTCVYRSGVPVPRRCRGIGDADGVGLDTEAVSRLVGAWSD